MWRCFASNLRLSQSIRDDEHLGIKQQFRQGDAKFFDGVAHMPLPALPGAHSCKCGKVGVAPNLFSRQST